MKSDSFFNFFINKKDEIFSLTFKHLQLSILAVIIAILIGIPLGILISKKKKLAPPIIGLANVLQAIPSLALMGFLIPFFGIGEIPAIIMVCLYSLLPIIKNTYTGLINISPATIEAGQAMGMTEGQLLRMVQLPLALPIIMAGVRISAVTAVGLMTISAFIGAGGLGSYIYTGVQTVNTNMILAGAVPACILALIMDFVIGRIEKMVEPKNKKNKLQKRSMAIASVMLVGIILIPLFTSAFSKGDKIVVGSKNYTENKLLANIFAILIEEKTNIKVERKFDLAGTDVVFKAINKGEVDIYPEYTGTALVSILKKDIITDPSEAYKLTKNEFKEKYDLEMLNPLGFNNTYTLAVRKEDAEKYNLNTFSDLSKMSNQMVLGATYEFIGRDDGLIGLNKKYGMNFKDTKGLDSGLRYTAIDSKKTDVTDAFSTDGLLVAFDLKVLKDDKKFFPPYEAVPVVRADTLKKYPEVKPLLDSLGGVLNDETMRQLNYQCDKLGKDPANVARDFLKSKGLI